LQINETNLLDKIYKIRKEIGHDPIDISIREIIFKEETNDLWIITTDRPDKSAIIGKGGWVVGKLREDLGVNSIHVESYSDFLTKKYRMELSLNTLDKFLKDNLEFSIPLSNLRTLVLAKIEDIYSFNLTEYFKHHTFIESGEHEVVVALSGGADSCFSLILAKMLGFNPVAISVDPGTIVLPKQFKENIDNLCEILDVPHEYVTVDYSDIISEAFNGRFHPCGRCSEVIEETVLKYSLDNNIPIVIFGDMLSTGSQCITKQFVGDEEIIRLNLPASLSSTKMDHKNLNKNYNLKKIDGFGCPLLYEVHKKHPYMKKYSIQRILRETRSGALEPGEALSLIWSFYRTE
jgi:predicted PP-loop superfamily ATPase